MNTAEKKLIEKLKEVIMHVGGFGEYNSNTDISEQLRFTENCPECWKLADEISALESQSEVSYPREFVEWINWEDDRDNFHYIKDYTTNKFLNCDENMKEYTTDELFDYWQSKVKNE